MSTSANDVIDHPLAIVEALYQQRLSSLPRPSQLDVANDFGEREVFEGLLQDTQLSASIPLLSSAGRRRCIGHIKQDSLVRYRGLVQDIYDCEYYCASFDELSLSTQERRKVLSKYRDTVPFSSIRAKESGAVDFHLDGPFCTTLERLPILCIPIPGESEWAKGYFGDVNGAPDDGAEEGGCDSRKRREIDAENDRDSNNKSIKVSADGNGTHASKGSGVRFADDIAGDGRGDSKIAINSGSIFDPITRMNEGDSVVCVAKIYATDSSSIRLNDMLEIVGVYSTNDGSVAFADQSQDPGSDIFSMEPSDLMPSLVPPASLAPRVHCLTFRRIGSLFPLLAEISPPAISGGVAGACVAVIPQRGGLFALNSACSLGSTEIASLLGKSTAMRGLIIDSISSILGDTLASEYLFLSLLSKVYARPNDLTLGYLPLNILGFGKGDPRIARLHRFLSGLLPRTSLLNASLDQLNGTPYMPARNYATDRIPLSPLQVGSGTLLLIDDTQMAEGQLGVEGFKSMTAVRSVVATQKLPVDFSYCKVDVPTDVTIVFLSHSSPSILSPSEVVKICLSPSSSSSSSSGRDSELAGAEDQARQWIQIVRSLPLSVDEVSSTSIYSTTYMNSTYMYISHSLTLK